MMLQCDAFELTSVKINRGILMRLAYAAILVISQETLLVMLRDPTQGCILGGIQIDHCSFMNDFKLFTSRNVASKHWAIHLAP